MKKLKKINATAIVLLFLAIPLIQISRTDAVDFTAKDMMPAFLSEVVGFDLTNYNITNEGYNVSYPSYYGGLVKDEVIRFTLESNSSEINVMGIFNNGFIYGIVIHHINGSIMYSRQPSTNALDESRNILQRYKTFAQNYGFDISHIDSALTLLNNATRASSASDELHMFNDLIGFVPSVTTAGNMKQETTQRGVSWIYTEKGVDMPNKCLKIDFGIDKLHFVDTWNLFTVGCVSVVSEDEVKQIAFDAANNYNLTLVGENGTLIVTEKPEWSNVTSIVLNMVPGEIYKDELSKKIGIVSGGNATRDPLVLYPLWETVLYFSERVGSVYGIAVGVWGDTTEIAYITPYGYLDAPAEDPDTTTPTDPPVNEPEETSAEQTEPSSTQTENTTKLEGSNPPSSTYLIAGIAVTATAVAVAVVFLKKRRR